MSKRIAVLGVGAIGGVIGGYLARAGHDVTLIDQWPLNVDTINGSGLTVTALEEEFTVRPMALHLCDVAAAGARFDIVLLAVKSYDTEWSARFIEPYLAPGGYLVSCQNGINDDRIAALVGWTRVVGCVITLGAGMYEPAHPLRTSPYTRHSFTLGELTGVATPRLKALAEVMAAVGHTRTTTNLWGERWAKLAVNSMSNAVAGFTGLKSAELRQLPDVRRVTIKIAAEVVRVGSALGVSIEPIGGVPAPLFADALTDGAAMEEVEGKLLEGARDIGTGRPSLSQDVMKGRRTEVDFLNGYVVRKGIEAGVATPVNEAVVALARRIEAGELSPSIDNLKYLR